MTTQTSLLQARALSKTYHHGSTALQALKRIDLTLFKGAFTALVGLMNQQPISIPGQPRMLLI